VTKEYFVYQFNDFTLDSHKSTLCKKDQAIDATDKVIALLAILIEAPGTTFSRDYLLDALWPGQIVGESSLSHLVSETRQVLGDNGKEPTLLHTVRGKGFRLDSSLTVYKQPIEPNSPANKPILVDTPRRINYVTSAIIMVVALVAAIIWWRAPLNNTNVYVGTEQLMVWPVTLNSQDPQDLWIEYGVMSLVTQYLQGYSQLNVTSTKNTLKGLASITINDDKTPPAEAHRRYCQALGCKQSLSLRFSLDNNTPKLSYTLARSGQATLEFSFIHHDILQCTQMLLEHLIDQLLPPEPERLSLSDTYTDNNKANQDYAIAMSYLHRADYADAIGYFDMALTKEPEFIWANIFKADALMRQNKVEKSRQIIAYVQGLNPDKRGQMAIDSIRSNIFYQQGKLAESNAISHQLLTQARALNDQQEIGNQLMNLGTGYLALGDNPKAISYLKQALAQYQRHDYLLRSAQALHNLGNTVWVGSGDQALATEFYQQAITLFRQLGSRHYLAMAKHQLVGIVIAQGHLKQAIRQLEEIKTIYQQINNIESALLVDADLAIIAFKQHDLSKAIELSTQTFKHSDDYAYPRTFSAALSAFFYLHQEQPHQATGYLKVVQQAQWNDPRPWFIMLPATYQHQLGQYNRAVKEAKEIKKQLGEQWNADHQRYLNAFIESVATNKRGKVNYLTY